MRVHRVVKVLAALGTTALLLVQPAVPAASAPPRLTLVFDVQPADAKIGETVTSVPFDPSAPRASVTLKDGNRVSSARTSVVFSLVPESGAPIGLGTVTTDRGVATVPVFDIDTAGQRFTLHASAPDVPTEATSRAFDVYEIVAPCTPGNCRAAIGRPQTINVEVTANSNSGFLALNVADLPAFAPGECGVGNELSHAPMLVTQDEAGIDVDKIAVMTIAKEIVESRVDNNGASFYEVCFSKDGLTFQDEPLGACPARRNRSQPCVISNNKTGAGDVQITLFLPAGDPTWW